MNALLAMLACVVLLGCASPATATADDYPPFPRKSDEQLQAEGLLDATGHYNPSGGATVHVRGYYRKDGTYVSPHTHAGPRPGTDECVNEAQPLPHPPRRDWTGDGARGPDSVVRVGGGGGRWRNR